MPTTGWIGPIIELHPLPAAAPLAVASAIPGRPSVKLRGPRAIVDQENVACCISCALATCLESLHSTYPALAPLFHYVQALSSARVVTADNLQRGLTIAEGRSALVTHGMAEVRLHSHPYRAPQAATAPTAEAVRDGLTRVGRPDRLTGVGFFRSIDLQLDPVGEIKRALLQSKPVLFGIHLTSGRQRLRAGQPRLDPVGAREANQHAVACLGFDDNENSFIIQDSFGADFGQGGQWYLPYPTFAASDPVVFEAVIVGFNIRRR